MPPTRRSAISLMFALLATAPAHADPAAPPSGDQQRAAETEVATLPLPADPDIATGRLSNGLRFVITRGPEPKAGEQSTLALLLQFDAGSAHEADDQIGAARMAAELVASGSLADDRDTLTRSFSALGVDRRRPIRPSVGYTSSRFILSIPLEDGRGLSSADIARAAEAMSGLLQAGEAPLDDRDVDSARHELLSSQHAWSGPSQRITARALPQMFGDSVFGRRVPIYTPEAIESTSASAIHDFARTWYTPRHATLVVVGPVDAALMRRAIEKAFGPLDGGVAVDGPDLSIPRPERGVVLIESDPGVAGDVIQLMLLESEGQPLTSEDAMRDRLTENVAMVALNRRLEELARSGSAATLQAGAFTNPDAGGYRMSMLSVAGAPGDWARLTREAVASIHSAQEFGFTRREIEAAKDRVRQGIDAEFARSARRSSVGLAAELAAKVHRGDTLVSAQTSRQVALASLPSIGERDLNQALKRVFNIDALAKLVVTGEAGPDAEAVRRQIEIARTLDARAVAEASPMAGDAPLFGEMPTDGQATHLRFDPGNEVTSATLASGVTLHHRPMDAGSGRIEIAAAITLPRTPSDPPSDAMAQAELDAIGVLDWQPATTDHSSRRIAQALAAHDVDFDVDVDARCIVFELSASPDQFDFAMQLLGAMLRSAQVEPAAIERWRIAELQSEAEAQSEPARAALRVFEHHIARNAGEPTQEIRQPAARQLQAEAVQRRLDGLLRSAPLAVAITGDIERARALQTGAAMLSNLPARDASARTATDHDDRANPTGPFDIRIEQELGGPVGAVVVGFVGADASSVADAAALDAGASILQDRLRERFKAEVVGGASVSAWNIDADDRSETARFWVRAIITPEQSDLAVSIMEAELTRLRDQGPTQAELADVVKRQIRSWQRRLESPSQWADALARSAIDAGESVRTLRARAEEGFAPTTDSVREALERYATTERSFRIVVLPKPGVHDEPNDAHPADSP